MKGKKYPVSCVSKDTVMAAAKERKFGGRANIDGGANKRVKSVEIGALPDGPAGSKHAGRHSRGVHGKPLLSAASGAGQVKGHKASPEGVPSKVK